MVHHLSRRFILVAAALLAAAPPALGADPIVGTWAEVDEDGEVGAWIAITAKGGLFEGRIVKLFPGPGEPAEPVCGACDGQRKDAPVLGMTVVAGLRRQGDKYSGGRILDPDDGTEYQLEAHLGEGGKTLTIHAFSGISLLGRTQVWRRQP
jgi:uncharacterized protein (DUF2147 family)